MLIAGFGALLAVLGAVASAPGAEARQWAASSTIGYPPDPHAEEYLPPRPGEVGVAPGQLRLSVGAGVGVGADVGVQSAISRGAELHLQATFELMTVPYLGVRVSSSAHPTFSKDEIQIWAIRAGPSLHLLPYRIVDVALFVEGGVATVDLFLGSRTAMPEIVPGLAVNLHLGPALFLLVETSGAWGVFQRGGQAYSRVRWVNAIGLGVGL